MQVDQTEISRPPVIQSKWARQGVFRILSHLQRGQLQIQDPLGEATFGHLDSEGGLHVRIQVHDLDCYRLMLTGGSNGAAESYLRGHWDTDELTALIQLLLRNRKQMDALEGIFSTVSAWASRIWHNNNRNTRLGSQRNIAAHYDLGNEFFRLFLDRHQMYSSALYQTADDDLEQASINKMEAVCRKLQLCEDDRVIEIGSGWGGMAVYAAHHYGCHVTTTTISQEQYNAACERVKVAGLEHKVTVLKQDYRDLQGRFDKLISIEMVEAVGHQFLPQYFTTINRLLKKDGRALIQAITIDDNQYKKALKQVDFIKRYIFPGSFIPCVTLLTQEASNNQLRLFNLEDLGASYARTLHDWSHRFHGNLDQVRAQGFDERFIRMWRFYLSYCEGGFLERAISDVQMLLLKMDDAT